MYYILYNPMSSQKNQIKKINKLYQKLSKNGVCYKINLIEINQMEKAFISRCTEEDNLIMCGGDGTLDVFVNRIQGTEPKCKFWLFRCGTGNDFSRDFKKKKLFEVTEYIKNLPTAIVNGVENYVFLNGVGIGIDAVVCRSVAQYKFSQVKKGYFSISTAALKTFRPYELDIEIDGEKKHYKDVWFFVANNGCYMGGGMKVTPNAIRNDGILDLCIVHGLSKRKILWIFPTIYLGIHTMFKKNVEIIKCKSIKAYPDGCTVMQRDGEVLDYIRSLEVIG